jgi:hypothetical protein
MTSILPLVVVFLLFVAIAVPIAIRTNIDYQLFISRRGKGGLNRKNCVPFRIIRHPDQDSTLIVSYV